MTQGYTPDGYTLTMTYDAENRLKTAEYTDSSSVVHRTEYFYSGDSLLAEMKKFENGVLVSNTKYVSADFLPVQERDGSNNVTREYTWGIDMGGGVGGLLNLKQGGSDYSYLYDGKGNVSALIDSSQNVIASYRYDTFGVLLKKVGTFDQPFRFSTKRYDEKTGLYYYGYRFYNASTGKWTTRDPISEEGGVNLYEFVGNSPCNFVDPLGLEAEVCTRTFYSPFFFLIPARHCYIRFNGNSKDTLSFDLKGVHPDPAPKWWPGQSCSPTKGKQDDECVKKEMNKCKADQYNLTGFNCCHCAENALKACGQSSSTGWPNWPINPGPQPGEPGYNP